MLMLAGCCSSELAVTEPDRPPLPVGRPVERTEDLARRAALWRDSVDLGLAGQVVTLPAADLDLLLQDRAEWRAWALALERAGRWR